MIRGMYDTVLLIHSWVRWAVLICAVLAVGGALMNLMQRKPWNAGNDRAALFFTITADIQLLLGVLLFVVGPAWISMFLEAPGKAMGNDLVRYWSIEHGFGMIVAIALAHVGKVLVRKKTDGMAKNKTALIWFGISLVIMLITIPWGFNPDHRPLFRM